MENKPDLLDKLEKYLMEDIEEISSCLAKREMDVLRRIKAGYVYWLNRPSKTPTHIARYLRKMSPDLTGKELSRTQAFRDAKNIEILLGKIRQASKDWKRYQFEQMALETYAIAKSQRNPIAMAAAADKFGKYNQLDKEDVELIPWEKMMPPIWEPSSDVTLVGVEPLPNLPDRIKKLKEKYGVEESNDTKTIYVEENGEG